MSKWNSMFRIGLFLTLKKEIQAIYDVEYSGECTIQVKNGGEWFRCSFDTSYGGWNLRGKLLDKALWEEHNTSLLEEKDWWLLVIKEEAEKCWERKLETIRNYE